MPNVRVVLDTNVVVSALLWGGLPYRLIDIATAGTIDLYTSPVLIAELAEILDRDHIAQRLLEQRTSAEAVLALYARLARVVSPTTVARVVAEDPDDDHLIACAVLAGAELIVTGDRALLSMGKHETIVVCDPRGAIEMLERRGA